MKRKTKTMSLLLASVLALAVTGCTNNNASNAPSSSGTNDGTGTADAKPLRFSAALPSYGKDEENSMIGKEWKKQMEEYMGRPVDIDFNYIPASEYDEKLKLMIASDDLPDFFVTPLFYDTTEMAAEGQILELSQYKDAMPNYMNYLSKVKNGMARVTTPDGKMYSFKETSLPRFEEDKGLLIQNTSSYRYDLFQQNNIKIPETWDDVYEAAKKLKELYPDKYPIATRWNSLRSLFAAAHVKDDIYWDGSKYIYGVLQDGYRDALQFANKLYAEKLLDPEYTIDTDDTLKRKALNGDNFMWLTQWFTTPAEYTRTANDGKVFAVTLYPDNPAYGKSWQEVANGNTPDLGWGTYCINAKTKNPEELIKFVDYQYSEKMYDLITWGIEGTTYTVGADGAKTFTDEFKNAEDPWLVGDKYGIRASKNYRPGLQIAADSKAFVDFAAKDYTYFDGKYEEVAIEKSPYLRSLPMPDNDYVPSSYSEPSIQFTQEESQQISEIMNPVKTFVTEEQAKFVSGKNNFDNWSAFTDKLKKMGDIDKVLQIYNDAAARAQK